MNSIYSLEELLEATLDGQQFKYVFFWGNQPPKDGTVSSTCLSQWYEIEFTIDEIVYRNAEQYMMAEKARLFGDTESLEKILASNHPGEAKKLGRQVTGFVQQIWEEKRFDIVCRGNFAKFTQNDSLGQFLLNTKDRILVEASPIDKIWGIGLTADDELANKPEHWQGDNLLGFALMKVRDEIINESSLV